MIVACEKDVNVVVFDRDCDPSKDCDPWPVYSSPAKDARVGPGWQANRFQAAGNETYTFACSAGQTMSETRDWYTPLPEPSSNWVPLALLALVLMRKSRMVQ